LGALAILPIAIGLTAVTMRDPPCDGGTPALARVWTPERGDAIGRAFELGAPTYGVRAWQRTAEIVQEYGDAWSEEHRAACEAERVGLDTPRVHDLRLHCLARTLDHLDALLVALAHADAESIEHGVDAAAQLPELAGCADVDALLAVKAAPTP